MKVLLVSDGNSIHTIRWAVALKRREIEIGIFSIQPINHSHYENIGIEVRSANGLVSFNPKKAKARKIFYITALPSLKSMVRSFNPDILHSHFASSYGLLGALSGFKPLIVSVWGTDVFDFPRKNKLFKALLRFNLARADRVLSTSQIMAEETRKYTSQPIIVTPFGVELDKFCRDFNSEKHSQDFVIGTVKTLEEKYGIDLLIKAFHLFYQKNGVGRLLIAGDGSDREKLEKLCNDLEIKHRVTFLGQVNHNQIPELLRQFDCFVALSRHQSESFGVAIVEAQAAGLPVIVSDIGGLSEVVQKNVTGFIVKNESIEEAAAAMEEFLCDPGLRLSMGMNGRKRVEEFYDWDKNVEHMCQIYHEVYHGSKGRK
jgi:glycosyltransferase involved in cell wall biosynthesis